MGVGVARIQARLAKVLVRLQGWNLRLSCGRGTERPQGSGEPPKPDVGEYMDWLAGMDDRELNSTRRYWEIEYGVFREDQARDPHLYAVYEPTKSENLQRIQNILDRLDPAFLNNWLAHIMPVLRKIS